jgi:site-specific recombinase XerD
MNRLAELLDLSQRAERTKRAYRRCVNRFVSFAGEDPAGWTPLVVASWRDQLATRLSPRTTNKHLYALRTAARLFELYDDGRDFARAVEVVQAPMERKRRALTFEEARALMGTCESRTPRDLRDRAALTLGIRTGLRVSELVGLAWPGISGREAHVAAKGNKAHVVILDDDCLMTLAEWADWLDALGDRRSGPVLRGISQQRIDGSFRLTPRLSRQRLHRALSERGKAAGLRRPIHAHLLRHTFVSWALEAGVPPQRVMMQTGHLSLAALSRYVTDLEASADPVGAYLPSLEEEEL